ncbi:hypothetical protein K438DRAFT_1777191 [Mycena galopus ATCC 62051]|nr:hypothetical protein K438DRAFT_1777191 [Mycena galopus ATCC 62051]
MFKLVKRENKTSRPIGRDGGETGKEAFKKGIICFGCKREGHYKDKCPDSEKAEALFAQREIVDDNSDEESQSEDDKPKKSSPPTEHMREAHEWSSESEYTLQAFSEYSISDSEERCAQINEGIPELWTDDSGEEEDDDIPQRGNHTKKAESIRKRQLSYPDGFFQTRIWMQWLEKWLRTLLSKEILRK